MTDYEGLMKAAAFKADRLVEVNGGMKHRSTGYVVKLSTARTILRKALAEAERAQVMMEAHNLEHGE